MKNVLFKPACNCVTPSVPITSKVLDYGSDRSDPGEEGAKNPWVRSGCHVNTTLWIITSNVRTVLAQDRIIQLGNELTKIKWDIVGLNKIQKREEDWIILKSEIIIYTGSQYSGVVFISKKTIKTTYQTE